MDVIQTVKYISLWIYIYMIFWFQNFMFSFYPRLPFFPSSCLTWKLQMPVASWVPRWVQEYIWVCILVHQSKIIAFIIGKLRIHKWTLRFRTLIPKQRFFKRKRIGSNSWAKKLDKNLPFVWIGSTKCNWVLQCSGKQEYKDVMKAKQEQSSIWSLWGTEFWT